MSKFCYFFSNYTTNGGKFRKMHVTLVSQALSTKKQMKSCFL